jgi:hypothetical protein
MKGGSAWGPLAAAVILKRLLFKMRHADRPQILPGHRDGIEIPTVRFALAKPPQKLRSNRQVLQASSRTPGWSVAGGDGKV